MSVLYARAIFNTSAAIAVTVRGPQGAPLCDWLFFGRRFDDRSFQSLVVISSEAPFFGRNGFGLSRTFCESRRLHLPGVLTLSPVCLRTANRAWVRLLSVFLGDFQASDRFFFGKWWVVSWSRNPSFSFLLAYGGSPKVVARRCSASPSDVRELCALFLSVFAFSLISLFSSISPRV